MTLFLKKNCNLVSALLQFNLSHSATQSQPYCMVKWLILRCKNNVFTNYCPRLVYFM
ncbi:hypothetical protein HMPREF9944_02358 [Segatella maculosa OT 289]|uniref:Uncharacterized protein n=1 Tax=Segatella maculosa OT 289 TaxID=999422 RepID=H1HQ33_9BACT|nr:hypothetical protein HMPREF9944_02358 [Segatella maculosa OT 289]